MRHDYVQFRDPEPLRKLDAIEFIHSRDLVHGDISLGNVVLPLEDESKSKISLIDYGLSRPYKRLNPASRQMEHVADVPTVQTRGDRVYASLNNHLHHSEYVQHTPQYVVSHVPPRRSVLS